MVKHISRISKLIARRKSVTQFENLNVEMAGILYWKNEKGSVNKKCQKNEKG